jgi:fructose-1,6-bisphosphatase I/sedoheptulose-1,7-bisphosphatase
LLYEANPVAFLIEEAGGLASTGRERILDVTPDELHQRIAFIFGAREEVERIEGYHRDYNAVGRDAPLYSTRGLFRTNG